MSASRLARVAAAGVAATWFMDRVDKVVYRVTPDEVHRREAELEDLTGPGQFARAVMRAFGREPTHDEAVRWGRVAHIGFGVLLAIAYPPLAKRVPVLRAANGAVYGLIVSPANLAVVPALGLTPPSTEFPLATNLRVVAYHIGYGVALESLSKALRVHDDAA
jgi:uncharacterized membrane protein YagU involved in acid resistance